MKVLVIDDDRNIVQMIRVNLEMDGLDVSTARNGAEGIEKARKFKPDLILMDWMMPVMNGIETVQNMKKDAILRHIPIFMLTAKSQISEIDLAFKAGADNYISKPVDPIELSKIITSKMEKRIKERA